MIIAMQFALKFPFTLGLIAKMKIEFDPGFIDKVKHSCDPMYLNMHFISNGEANFSVTTYFVCDFIKRWMLNRV